jgi:hypothetical protein
MARMAFDPRKLLAAPPPSRDGESGNAPPDAPLAGNRNETVQRLQIGLFGLGAMVLLVGLANIIMTSAQQNQADAVPEAAPTVAVDEQEADGGSDPLADAGVVPEVSSEPSPQPPITPPATLPAAPSAAQPAVPGDAREQD